MPCHKKHKMFLVYCQISTKEGLCIDTDLDIQELRFGNYNKDLYRECEWCYCVFETEKNFNANGFICDEFYELLQMEDIRETISPKIHILWRENQQCRVCTNIYRSFAESIFNKENVKSRKGKISKETLSIYLNSSASNDIKESHWVALHLCCPIKSLYAE